MLRPSSQAACDKRPLRRHSRQPLLSLSASRNRHCHHRCSTVTVPSRISGFNGCIFDALTAYLEVLALYVIYLRRYFHIHMEITDDRHAMTLRNITASFECILQVPLQPTHRHGGTLDVVVTKVVQEVLEMAIDPADVISSMELSVDVYHSVIDIQLCWNVNAGAGANSTKMNSEQHSSTLSCATSTVIQILWKSTLICTTTFYRVWQISLHQ